MRILVLGIGNVLFGDEGVGVHFINAYKKCYKTTSETHSVDFIDGGTLANNLSGLIAEYDYAIIVDCIAADDSEVGDVYFFDFEAMPKSISWSGSAHEIEMLQTLEMMDLLGDRPKTKILAIVPKRIEPMTFQLSKELIEGVKIMEKTLTKHLQELGIECKKKSEFDIQEAASGWKKQRFIDTPF